MDGYKLVGYVRRLAIKTTDNIVFCSDCGKKYIIDANTPLKDALPGHLWGNRDGEVRHPTYDDWLEEQADKELCPECGCYPCEHTRGAYPA